ncbi:alpha/beta fold hydrolase [Nocardia sp. NPDC058518]|uniref:alpha/beta fold hydrolase n=1 Tax=Nocardia sp. NPDC058518 TaxID=3346534 RepID=UPI0036492A37
MKAPARGEPLGSLLLNPGGPGGPGVGMAASTSTALLDSPVTEKFDLIGFDPRGVGASTPAIDCLTDEELDNGGPDVFPSASVGGKWTEHDTRTLVERCAERSGGEDVLTHVGTRDAARDMDVLRAALGDEKLSFLGQSYGTRLGAVYAEMFPRNVRAMVLDGAVDPRLGTAERRISQFTSFQRAFDAMATDCATRPECPLGTDPVAAAVNLQKVISPLIDQPIPAGAGRQLTYNLAIGGVIVGLYDSAAWPAITRAITEVGTGRGDIFLALNDVFAQRTPDGRWPNFNEALYAINCMDEQRHTPEQETELRREIHRVAPFMNPGRGADGARDGCESWSAAPTLDYPYATDIEGLPATLTISITGDPTTPYEGGISLANALGGSMLTVEGERHTIASAGTSRCVDDIVAAYLIDLKTPPVQARCAV